MGATYSNWMKTYAALSDLCVDPAVPAALRTALASHERGEATVPDGAEMLALTQALVQPPALVAALSLGGADFARRLLADRCPGLTAEALTEAVVGAFLSMFGDPDAQGDLELSTAQALVDDFSLGVAARALPDLLRARLLIAVGASDEVPEAALAAVRLQAWAVALGGMPRLQRELGDETPRDVHGWAAMCLHQLGRYAEAEATAQHGLGEEQRRMMAIPAAVPESELLRRWGGRTEPVVSILCMTYNHARYVERALQGFLSQDVDQPFEVLIHDDASTDGTQDIIRAWQARYPTIIQPILQTQNQFSRGVRPFDHLLLPRARGRFIATCEGDDFWIRADKLTRQIRALEAHPDVSCVAHNYHLYVERSLLVRTWTSAGRNVVLSPRQLMDSQFLLWCPTLMFRRQFDALPPERDLAAFGDQFLVSWLGCFGKGIYLDDLVGAVRRENEFSSWSPLPEREKERRRATTWAAMMRLHERLGHPDAAADLMAKIQGAALDPDVRRTILEGSLRLRNASREAA